MRQAPILFASRTYQYLLDRILALHPYERGEVEVDQFPDGERYQCVKTDVSEREVVLIAGTVTDADTLELYDLACTLVKLGVRELTLVVPYFAYSTMERSVKYGEVITAKTRARLLSSIPMAMYGNRIVLMDLHSEGIPHYFEGGIVPTHLYAKPVILDAARRLGGEHFVLASTDAGRAKWVESLANDLGVDAAFVLKRRIDGSRTELTAMNARVEGAEVVIYDDMIRTGGSLINAAKAYMEAGATGITAIATHGILPEGALAKIRDSGHFRKVLVTDTHPRALELEGDFLEVASVAGLFHDYLQAHF